jgi:hypothetical protein
LNCWFKIIYFSIFLLNFFFGFYFISWKHWTHFIDEPLWWNYFKLLIINFSSHSIGFLFIQCFVFFFDFFRWNSIKSIRNDQYTKKKTSFVGWTWTHSFNIQFIHDLKVKVLALCHDSIIFAVSLKIYISVSRRLMKRKKERKKERKKNEILFFCTFKPQIEKIEIIYVIFLFTQ